LIDVIEEADNVLSRKATFLIGEVLALANRLLPGGIAADAQVRVAASLQHARQLTLRSHLFLAQALSRLFTHAARLDSPLQKNKAISALAAIHRLNRTRTKVQAAMLPQSIKRARSNSVPDPLLRGQRQVESVKIRMGLQVDDRYFQMLLNDTGVRTIEGLG
jgi:rapamycin-insensitive companion of mTOR